MQQLDILLWQKNKKILNPINSNIFTAVYSSKTYDHVLINACAHILYCKNFSYFTNQLNIPNLLSENQAHSILLEI